MDNSYCRYLLLYKILEIKDYEYLVIEVIFILIYYFLYYEGKVYEEGMEIIEELENEKEFYEYWFLGIV